MATIIERLAAGEIVQVGNKLQALCQTCGSLIQLNKPLLGSLHICLTDEESRVQSSGR